MVSHLPCQEYNGNSKIDVVDVELELLRIVIQQRNVLKHELEIDSIQLQEKCSVLNALSSTNNLITPLQSMHCVPAITMSNCNYSVMNNSVY